MQAMVLAAGLGTRLWPLTDDRAKPAVPFLGKPLVVHVLDLLEAHGVDRAVVNTHHLPESIHSALARKTGRIAIATSHEDRILGTAGAIAKAREAKLLDPGERVLAINAKLYTDLDLGAAMRAHEASAKRGAKVTMVLRPNLEKQHFREVLVEGDRVAGFGESRVPEGPSPLLFTGIHVLEPEVIRAIPLEPCDTVADVYPPLIERREVAAHIDPRGRWWEFSTLERYLDLHVRAHEEGLSPEVVESEGAWRDPGARVRHAVLWENARIEAGARVERVILGTGAVVPAGEVVEGAVIVRRDRVDREEARKRGEPFGADQIKVPLEAPRS
jgi:mannose-1-phosphate guanylyltransferase